MSGKETEGLIAQAVPWDASEQAQPHTRPWGWDYEICTGCSASLTMADIKASGKVSCCPDRRMVTVRELVDAYEARTKRQDREPQPAPNCEGCDAPPLHMHDEDCPVMARDLAALQAEQKGGA